MIDERVDHHLKQHKKKEKELRKQLDEVYAMMDDFFDRPGSSERRKRFQEYDDLKGQGGQSIRVLDLHRRSGALAAINRRGARLLQILQNIVH